MTDGELVQALAERVMGWRLEEDDSGVAIVRMVTLDGTPVDSFSPLHSWSDAGRLIERVRHEFWIRLVVANIKSLEAAECRVGRYISEGQAIPDDKICKALATSGPRAICYAIAKAYGIEYEGDEP